MRTLTNCSSSDNVKVLDMLIKKKDVCNMFHIYYEILPFHGTETQFGFKLRSLFNYEYNE